MNRAKKEAETTTNKFFSSRMSRASHTIRPKSIELGGNKPRHRNGGQESNLVVSNVDYGYDILGLSNISDYDTRPVSNLEASKNEGADGPKIKMKTIKLRNRNIPTRHEGIPDDLFCSVPKRK